MFNKKLKERMKQLEEKILAQSPSMEHKVDVKHLDYETLKLFIAQAQYTGKIVIKFRDGTDIFIEGYQQPDQLRQRDAYDIDYNQSKNA